MNRCIEFEVIEAPMLLNVRNLYKYTNSRSREWSEKWAHTFKRASDRNNFGEKSEKLSKVGNKARWWKKKRKRKRQRQRKSQFKEISDANLHIKVSSRWQANTALHIPPNATPKPFDHRLKTRSTTFKRCLLCCVFYLFDSVVIVFVACSLHTTLNLFVVIRNGNEKKNNNCMDWHK